MLIHQVKELRSFGQNALGELRNLISDLRPPQLDDLGLAAALRWYVQSYEQRRQIAMHFRVEGDDSGLPAEYRTVLFRIAQEALTNIAKHAQATSAEVRLAVELRAVRLDVRDDGCGFDPQLVAKLETDRQAGWGLVGIRERALLLGGDCRIDTSPGAGTHLQVTVPLPDKIAAAIPAEPANEDECRTGIITEQGLTQKSQSGKDDDKTYECATTGQTAAGGRPSHRAFRAAHAVPRRAHDDDRGGSGQR